MRRLGVVLSSGGSAFFRAIELLGWAPERVFVVTDRACGAEDLCQRHGIAHRRIPFEGRSRFSHTVRRRFLDEGCDIALLHYARLVGPELFDEMLTLNVHPALLPAFPGLDGIGDAHRAGTLFQGATLHLVDAGVDTGPPVAQTVHPVPLGASLDWRNRLGYIQKTIVTLYLLDMLSAGRVDTTRHDETALDRPVQGDVSVVNPPFASPDAQSAAMTALTDLPADPAWHS